MLLQTEGLICSVVLITVSPLVPRPIRDLIPRAAAACTCAFALMWAHACRVYNDAVADSWRAQEGIPVSINLYEAPA